MRLLGRRHRQLLGRRVAVAAAVVVADFGLKTCQRLLEHFLGVSERFQERGRVRRVGLEGRVGQGHDARVRLE